LIQAVSEQQSMEQHTAKLSTYS